MNILITGVGGPAGRALVSQLATTSHNVVGVDMQEVALADGSLAAAIYGSTNIKERHRHRYEVNNHFVPALEKAGLVISGVSGGRERLVETIELPQGTHPWFFASQFHPEFTSTPRKGHPLFTAFVKAALKQHQK